MNQTNLSMMQNSQYMNASFLTPQQHNVSMMRMHQQQIQKLQGNQATPDSRTPFFAELQPSHTGLSKMAAGDGAAQEGRGTIEVKQFQ